MRRVLDLDWLGCSCGELPMTTKRGANKSNVGVNGVIPAAAKKLAESLL